MTRKDALLPGQEHMSRKCAVAGIMTLQGPRGDYKRVEDALQPRLERVRGLSISNYEKTEYLSNLKKRRKNCGEEINEPLKTARI